MKDNIETRETEEGIGIFSYNHERGKQLHIGTVKADVYEKGNCRILQYPRPSFCLMPAELAAAENAGALFLRCLSGGTTYAISLADFRQFAEPYHNAAYGEQLRVQVIRFQPIHTTKKRNARRDNPVKQIAPLVMPFQLDMFGGKR